MNTKEYFLMREQGENLEKRWDGKSMWGGCRIWHGDVGEGEERRGENEGTRGMEEKMKQNRKII